jgi:cobalt-zinc-cadmium efflux system outer membrane protein
VRGPLISRQSATCSPFAALGLCVAFVGCVSTAIDSDLKQVRDLAQVETLAPLPNAEVDPFTPDEVHRRLRAPLDAEAAVRIALLGNRELRAALRELGVARGRALQAGLWPNPRAEAEFLPERNSRIELRLEYDLSRALLAPARANAAGPEIDAARFRAAAAVVRLGYRVRVAFHGLQAAEQRLELWQRGLDAAVAARDAARSMFQAGNLTELELAKQEASCERTRMRVAKLELELAGEREQLQRLLGVQPESTFSSVVLPLEPSPEQASEASPGLERRALGASLELRETHERLLALARRAGVEQASGWIPDVTVDLHSLHGNPDLDLPGTTERWRFGAGVSAEIPLFDRHQGNTAALGAEFDVLLERYHGLAIDTRSAAREAQDRLSSAEARARQYQSVLLPAQQRVTKQTLLQYNAMQIGIFQLLEARREELVVQTEYVDTLCEYWDAMAALGALLAGQRVMAETASGVPLSGVSPAGERE